MNEWEEGEVGKGSNSKVIDGNKIFGEEHTVVYTEVGM